MNLAHSEWKKELKYNRQIESNQKNCIDKNKEKWRIFYETDAFYTALITDTFCRTSLFIVAYIDKISALYNTKITF